VLLCAVYAVFGSVLWSAYERMEPRPALDEEPLAARVADLGAPGDLEVEEAVPADRGIFPADEILRRAMGPSPDRRRMAIEPQAPGSLAEQGEGAATAGTAGTQDSVDHPAPALPGLVIEQADSIKPQIVARGQPIIETPLDDPVEPAPQPTTVEAPDGRLTSVVEAGTPSSSEEDRAPKQEAAIAWPPKPTFKPLYVVAALDSAEATVPPAPDGLDPEAKPRRAARIPPKPAFKPFLELADLAEATGRDPRRLGSSEHRESRGFLGSLWSGLKELLDSPPRRVLLASGDGSGDLQAGDARADDRDDPAGNGGIGGGGSGDRTGDSDTGNDRGNGGRGADPGSDTGNDRGDDGQDGDRGSGGGADKGDGGRGGDRGSDGGNDRGEDGGRGGDRGNDRGGDHGGGRGGDHGGGRGGDHGGGRGGDHGGGRGGDHGGGRGGDHGGGRGGDHGGGRGGDHGGGKGRD
jgi:hypothetical protein